MAYIIGTLSKLPHLFLRFARSVRAAGETCEIVVADDGLPEDLDLSALQPITRIRCPSPFIFSRNANIVLNARPEHDVFLCNDDTEFLSPSAPTHFLEETSRLAEAGVVSAVVDGVVCHYGQHLGVSHEVRALDGTLCFVAVYLSRALINKVGLLDERFVGYGFEDDDYCYRTRLAGLRNLVDPRCVMRHEEEGQTFRKLLINADDVRLVSEQIFRAKYGLDPVAAPANGRVLVRKGQRR